MNRGLLTLLLVLLIIIAVYLGFFQKILKIIEKWSIVFYLKIKEFIQKLGLLDYINSLVQELKGLLSIIVRGLRDIKEGSWF